MKISYHNFKKQANENCFNDWFVVDRKWSGKLIYIRMKHHQLTIDIRKDFLKDMKNETNK